MTDALNIARWEWFKLRKRWMLWIMLLVLALMALTVWFEFFDYKNYHDSGGRVPFGRVDAFGGREFVDCSDLRSPPYPDDLSREDPSAIAALLDQCEADRPAFEEELREQYEQFALPGVLTSQVEGFYPVLLFLLIFLTASVIGSEYGTGTLRPAVGLGVGRWQYFSGKLLMLAIAFAAMLTFYALVIAVNALVAESLIGDSQAPAGEAVATWNAAIEAFAKTWLAALPTAAFAAMAAVVLGSNAFGLAATIGFVLSEGFLTSALDRIDWFKNVDQFLPGRAVTYFTDSGWLAPPDDYARPTDLESALIIVVYAVVFAAVGLIAFQRKDVRGAEAS